MLGKYKSFTSFSTSDIDKAREFYADKLHLEILFDMEGALGFKTGGDTSFNVYFKPDHQAANYTVLNFEVDDLDSVVDHLAEHGIEMESYPEMGTNDKGIASDDYGQMAWFKDPAGNIIGLLSMKG